MKYRITVKTIHGTPLTFRVNDYKPIEADFIEFFDEKTQKTKRFHASNCEIEILEGDPS